MQSPSQLSVFHITAYPGGLGPVTITGNYIQAAMVWLQTSGTSVNAVTSNLLVSQNHFTSDLVDWLANPRTADAGLLLDSLSTATFAGNIFENRWINPDNGRGVMFRMFGILNPVFLNSRRPPPSPYHLSVFRVSIPF
jgi:hypothetical protein